MPLTGRFRFRVSFEASPTHIIEGAKERGHLRRTIARSFLLFSPQFYQSTIVHFASDTIMTIQPWEQQAQKARDILQNSIPKQWLVPEEKLPPVTQKNVLDFPRQSGLLSEEELRITESSASELVAEMGAGKLKAEQTVVAFLKRSVMGQQLVSIILSPSRHEL